MFYKIDRSHFIRMCVVKLLYTCFLLMRSIRRLFFDKNGEEASNYYFPSSLLDCNFLQ